MRLVNDTLSASQNGLLRRYLRADWQRGLRSHQGTPEVAARILPYQRVLLGSNDTNDRRAGAGPYPASKSHVADFCGSIWDGSGMDKHIWHGKQRLAKEEPLMPPTSQDAGEKPLRIRRGRVESVDLYEIKDSELELFRRGSPADLQLNFAIFLFSIAFSSIAALETATFANKDVKTAFVVVVVVGLLLGAYLIISWLRNRTSLAATCDCIRERIKETDVVVSDTAITTIRGDLPPPKG